METISNLAGAASKAIWGESQTDEPVSGEQGVGTKEKPFDQGNDEKDNAGAKSSAAPAPAEAAGANPNNQAAPAGSGAPPQNDAPISGVDSTKDKGGPSEAQSSETTGDPSSAQKPEAKQQGADKPNDEPRPGEKGKDGKPVMPHTDSQREALVQKGEFPHDPDDHSGEPLKVHDGSEKRGDPREGGEGEGEGGTKPRSASVSQEGGDPHGSNKGTGEKYVKSSGLEADGGDFDATKPGAGAEATRLQEEKGVHKEKGGNGPAPSGGDSKDSKEPKVSKLQKIKDKLHIGSGKDLDNAK